MALNDEHTRLKDNAQDWTIKEQIIEDLASGLTIQFEVMPNSMDRYRLRIFGDLPFGNRELLFDCTGQLTGSGTHTTGLCKPTWRETPEDQPNTARETETCQTKK